MKASIVLALSGSLLAAANPIMKRAIFTTYETTTILVTVTVDPPTGTAQAAAVPTTTAVQVKTTKKVDPLKQQQQKTQKTNPVVSTSVSVPTTSSVVAVPVSSSNPATKAAAVSSANSASPSGGSGTSSASTSTPSDFQSTVLYHHNVHRQNHSASDLTYSDELAGYAAITAAKCVFAHDMTEGTGKYGQNIAYSSTNPTDKNNDIAQAISDLWYNSEVSLYPSSILGVSEPDTTTLKTWGHFTQIIWKSTTQVGCAVSQCPAGTLSSLDTWFAVCNYRSQGNMGGQYAANTGASLNKATIKS